VTMTGFTHPFKFAEVLSLSMTGSRVSALVGGTLCGWHESAWHGRTGCCHR
jgi:hypothetical protein